MKHLSILPADPATTGSSNPLHQGSGCVERVMNLLLVVVRQLIFLHVFAKSHSLGGDKDRLSSNWLNMPVEPGVVKPCRKYLVALTFRRPELISIDTVDGSEIPNNHLGYRKTLVK